MKAAVVGNGAVLLLAFAMSLGPLLYMSFSEKSRHQFPLNLILMGIFTVGESILVGACTASHASSHHECMHAAWFTPNTDGSPRRRPGTARTSCSLP